MTPPNDRRNESAAPRVAVIGTGTMGSDALRLLGAGMAVAVWSGTRARRRRWSLRVPMPTTSPRMPFGDAAAVITMVPNPPQITTDVMVDGQVLDAMPAGSVWVQMATIGAEATDQLAKVAWERNPGIIFVGRAGVRQSGACGERTAPHLASGPSSAAELLQPCSTHWGGPHSSSVRLVPAAG